MNSILSQNKTCLQNSKNSEQSSETCFYGFVSIFSFCIDFQCLKGISLNSFSLDILFGKGVWDLSFFYTLNMLTSCWLQIFKTSVSRLSFTEINRKLSFYQEGKQYCQAVQLHNPCFTWNQTSRCWRDEHQQFCKSADRLQINVHPNSFPSTHLFDKFRHCFFPKARQPPLALKHL